MLLYALGDVVFLRNKRTYIQTWRTAAAAAAAAWVEQTTQREAHTLNLDILQYVAWLTTQTRAWHGGIV